MGFFIYLRNISFLFINTIYRGIIQNNKEVRKILNEYINNYLIILAFLCLGLLLPVVALLLGKLLRPFKPEEAKYTTYESGLEPFHDSRVQFQVRYYMFALLFLIFDIETIFLYPWAVAYEKLGIFALLEMLWFVFMLVIGLIYAWKKKVLKWT